MLNLSNIKHTKILKSALKIPFKCISQSMATGKLKQDEAIHQNQHFSLRDLHKIDKYHSLKFDSNWQQVRISTSKLCYRELLKESKSFIIIGDS